MQTVHVDLIFFSRSFAPAPITTVAFTQPSRASPATESTTRCNNGYNKDTQRTKTQSCSATAAATAATATALAATKAAFAAATVATARRNEATGEPPPILGGELQAAAPILDPAALAKAGAAELHRLVLSSWTIPELMAAAESGGRGTGGNRGVQGRDSGGGRGGGSAGYGRKQGGAVGAGGREREVEEGEIILDSDRRHRSGGGYAGGSCVSGDQTRNGIRSAGGDTKGFSSTLWLSKVVA